MSNMHTKNTKKSMGVINNRFREWRTSGDQQETSLERESVERQLCRWLLLYFLDWVVGTLVLTMQSFIPWDILKLMQDMFKNRTRWLRA